MVKISCLCSEPDTVSSFCRHGFQTPSRGPSQRGKRKTSEEKLADFLMNGCGCSQQCFKFFDVEHYEDVMGQCAELSKDELDLVLLAQIMAHIQTTNVVGPPSKHSPKVRQRPRLTFSHHGRNVCKATFLMLHGVGKILSFL